MANDVGASDSPMLFLSDLSERDKPWDEHRTNALLVRDLYIQSGLYHRASRIDDCARHLLFALQPLQGGELRFRLKSSHFCRQRLCPVCQWRRMLMWRSRFFKRLPSLLEAYPSHRWLLLTLTVHNCPLTDLRATIKGMSRAWNKFVLYKDFPAVGWVKSLEVTRNPQTREAHPHYHVLMMVQPSYFKSKKYINHQRWRELWKQAIRSDYLPIVNIKTVKPVEGDSHPMTRGILETIKYGVKESDLLSDPEWLAELTSQMNKLQSVSLGGVVKQFLKEVDEDKEDLIHSDEDDIESELLDQYPSLLFDWMDIVKRYISNNDILEK